MQRADLLSGLFLIGFGLFIIQEASTLEYYYVHGPGPGFLPFWIGVLLVALALILAAMSAFYFYSEKERKANRADWWKAVRVAGTWVAFLFMIALADKIGFILSFAIFTAFLVFVVDRRSLSTGITVALAIAFGFYLIFVYAFGLRLPVGPWGF